MMGSQEYVAAQDGTDADFLAALYVDALGRPADLGGEIAFGQQLSAGATHMALAAAMLASIEARQNDVQAMYNHFLHRASDAGGANAFFQALQSGMSDVLAEAIMMGSLEFAGHI
jgi:hypothetical protein